MDNMLDIKLIQNEELLMKSGVEHSVEGDYIKDIRHVCLKNGKQATVVLLAMGDVDLYWNCKIVACSKESSVKFKYTKLIMNFNTILLQRENSSMASHSVIISLE